MRRAFLPVRARKLVLKADDPIKGRINLKGGTAGRSKGRHEAGWISSNCLKGRCNACYSLGCSCEHHRGISREYRK